MYTTHICSMNDQSLVTPHLRSLVRADLTRTQTQSMPAGILRVLLQTKLAIMMKFHPNKKISKSPCPGNLNSTRQYSGDGYQGAMFVFISMKYLLTCSTISLYRYVFLVGGVRYCSDLRSDWFEGVLEAVGLLVAVPPRLTRTGEREREREREEGDYQLSHQLELCTPDNIINFVTLHRKTHMGGDGNNGNGPERILIVYNRNLFTQHYLEGLSPTGINSYDDSHSLSIQVQEAANALLIYK